MNERIRTLKEQAGITTNLDTDYYEKDMNRWVDYFSEKFAELIIEECCVALHPMLRDMVSRSQGVELIKKHFGQHTGWVCPKCGVDRTKDVCPFGHTAAITGDCPMIATAQTVVEE